jgi:hypothetical protein
MGRRKYPAQRSCARELSDLRRFTRDLMAQMKRDLKTTLDWVAIDRHDTGHPRAMSSSSSGDYIAHAK